MTKEELLEKLKSIDIEHNGDTETAHIKADEALLEYINDKEIIEAYNQIDKWYA